MLNATVYVKFVKYNNVLRNGFFRKDTKTWPTGHKD